MSLDCSHEETPPSVSQEEPLAPWDRGPFLRLAPFRVPSKRPGKLKTEWRPVLHSWLVYRGEDNRLLKRPVRLDTLEVRTDCEPREASEETWVAARQMQMPGASGRWCLCQAFLDEMRAQRAGEAAE